MRLLNGISRADITSRKVVVVAVAVIARMHSTLSLARSKDALSLVYEGRKLCDLLMDSLLLNSNGRFHILISTKLSTRKGTTTYHSDTQ